LSGALPAATLVLFRTRAGGSPELLTVERSRALAFAGGATVFPGGRVDPGDIALARELAGGDPDDTAARIAAIRETLEEVGVPIGLSTIPSATTAAAMRAALHAGQPFGSVLASVGATLALDRLTPFARWQPDHAVARVFDTRFYLAELPAGAPTASADGGESVRATWTTAAGCLAAADRGEVTLIYPTRRNLERLALFGTFIDAVADARAHPIETITPWIEEHDGRPHLCIPSHLGYPITAEPIDAAQRG
jgi:8-oxo-dGTP pyrophosphatase MutT (NUDIX family)